MKLDANDPKAALQIDFGGSVGSRAQGGFNGLLPNVDIKQVAMVLENPQHGGPVNAAFDSLVDFQAATEGNLVIRKPELLRGMVEQLRAVSNAQIEVMVNEAFGDISIADSQKDLTARIRKIEEKLSYNPHDTKSLAAHQTFTTILEDFGGNQAAYYSHALKCRRDGIVEMFDSALNAIESKTAVGAGPSLSRYEAQLKHTYHAVQLDIDGTIDDRNNPQIYQLARDGVLVTLATARGRDEVVNRTITPFIEKLRKIHEAATIGNADAGEIWRKVENNFFVFGENGGFALNGRGQNITSHPFPLDQGQSEALAADLRRAGINFGSFEIRDHTIVLRDSSSQRDQNVRAVNQYLAEQGIELEAINGGFSLHLIAKGVNKGSIAVDLAKLVNDRAGRTVMTENEVVRIGDNAHPEGADYAMCKGFGGFSVGLRPEGSPEAPAVLDEGGRVLTGAEGTERILNILKIVPAH
jgi:hydroxymethylpyrimidine pyrophosphatase-like HAD family hydrolase